MSTSGVAPDDAEAIRQEQVAEIDRYYSRLGVRGGRKRANALGSATRDRLLPIGNR